MRNPRETFVRVALVLPTEFAYARGVLRGIIAATRERNLYAGGGGGGGARPGSGRGGRRKPLPWLFRIYRGIYGHSSKYLSKWFHDWDPHGIIGQIYDERLVKVYADTGKPVVELFESRLQSQFPRVAPDDVGTGAMAARHFIERGFRHFAFFGVPWMLWSRERETGFRSEIDRTFASRADLAARPAGGRDEAAGHSFASYGSSAAPGRAKAAAAAARRRVPGMNAWLASLPRPLALFAANDVWGFELVQAAREVGWKVPDDVAILGVDNEELLCEIAHPPLSSIRLAAEQIGAEAVTLLDQLLRGRSVSGVTRVPPLEVVTRQSTDVLAVEDPDVELSLRYIREHAASGLSVKELLEVVPVNRRTLERRFVNLLGHTPLDEIHRVRLERAKALLQTDLPVYDVAVRAGFSTSEYLATSFRRATGMTPSEYRQRFAPTSRWQRLPPA